jgi:hypothetical protein
MEGRKTLTLEPPIQQAVRPWPIALQNMSSFTDLATVVTWVSSHHRHEEPACATTDARPRAIRAPARR